MNNNWLKKKLFNNLPKLTLHVNFQKWVLRLDSYFDTFSKCIIVAEVPLCKIPKPLNTPVRPLGELATHSGVYPASAVCR